MNSSCAPARSATGLLDVKFTWMMRGPLYEMESALCVKRSASAAASSSSPSVEVSSPTIPQMGKSSRYH